MKRQEVINFLVQQKSHLKNTFGVNKIGLFGSFAREEQGDTSDIDIVVEIQSKNKFRSFFSLKYYLEEQLGRSVDLGIEGSLKPMVKKSIEKEVIYV
ncbi:nucleotidyltransferase family protein [Chrysiogenes arsenatis]|uniref:nucleotidyltransferase family protein n=1 Tax=Chrysiogenes arsenatis TaxID=309797 RepID=UPI0003F5F34A|nr:nucleotidyltransferase [Chrysiogenes arsenatis]